MVVAWCFEIEALMGEHLFEKHAKMFRVLRVEEAKYHYDFLA